MTMKSPSELPTYDPVVPDWCLLDSVDVIQAQRQQVEQLVHGILVLEQQGVIDQLKVRTHYQGVRIDIRRESPNMALEWAKRAYTYVYDRFRGHRLT